jgi:hypothetical protein
LTSGTSYHFRAISKDAAGNAAISSDVVFTTALFSPPPTIALSNVRVTNITDTSALVLWETNVPAFSVVEYGLTSAYGQTVLLPGLRPTHAVFLPGLSPDTLYHFRAISKDGQGNPAISPDFTFRTMADATRPANVFGFTATGGDRKVDLEWVLPPDNDVAYVIIVARDDRMPTDGTDGRIVYAQLGTATTDSGLQNGVIYYYGLFVVDAQGNVSTGSFASATPQGPPVSPGPNQGGDDDPTPSDSGPDDQDGASQGTATGTIPGRQGTSTFPAAPSTVSSTMPGRVEDISPSSTVPDISATSTEPIAAPDGAVYGLSFSFYTADGGLELSPDALGRVDLPVGQPVLVRVLPEKASSLPVRGRISVGSSVYALAPDGQGAWSTSFIPSLKPGLVEAKAALEFSNGAVAVGSAFFQMRIHGQVYEQSLLGKRTGVEGAQIFVYQRDLLVDTARYAQGNPILSQRGGAFAALVPRGTYRLVAKKEGYEDKEVEVRTMGNVLTASIELRRIPQGILDLVPRIQKAIDVIQSPEIQEAAKEVVAPVAAVVAVANVSTAASAANVLAYLRFLFTQPFLLFGRRRRKPWGVVYNALNKQPIDLAVVRLVHEGTGLAVQSRVTDVRGRFSFLVPSGSYRIEATKSGFTFPSIYLQNDQQDGDYTDVYHGERIEVRKDAAIRVNIPLDPEVKEELPKKIILKKILRKMQSVLGVLGVIGSLVALISVPTFAMAAFFASQVVLYALFHRLGAPSAPKDWGIVYEKGGKKALERTVVRIFNKRFNKLLETQVTDRNGKFGFYADKDVYYVTAERPGYEKYQSSDFDLSKGEEKVVSQDIFLKKAEKE